MSALVLIALCAGIPGDGASATSALWRSISAREFDEGIFVAQQAAEAIEAESDLGSGLPSGASEHAWHTLAWPLPRVPTSLPQADPDLLIEPGRPSRTDETLWLRPASVRVQPLAGVGYVAPRIATRPWIAAHVACSDAGPRGPTRRRV